MCRLCVLTAGLVLLQCVHAQTSSTGALSGTVIDPAHLIVSGVDIQLVNSGTRRSESTISDENGRFLFSFLPPGMYVVHADRLALLLLSAQ